MPPGTPTSVALVDGGVAHLRIPNIKWHRRHFSRISSGVCLWCVFDLFSIITFCCILTHTPPYRDSFHVFQLFEIQPAKKFKKSYFYLFIYFLQFEVASWCIQTLWATWFGWSFQPTAYTIPHTLYLISSVSTHTFIITPSPGLPEAVYYTLYRQIVRHIREKKAARTNRVTAAIAWEVHPATDVIQGLPSI